MIQAEIDGAAFIIKENVLVKRGNDRLDVSECEAAQGERAGLELLIVMDEIADIRRGR
jgi:hypothetical protein